MNHNGRLMKLKYIILFNIFLATAGLVQAQNTPNTASGSTATPVTVPGIFINPVTNFVRTFEPNIATTDTAKVASASRTPAVCSNLLLSPYLADSSTYYYPGINVVFPAFHLAQHKVHPKGIHSFH